MCWVSLCWELRASINCLCNTAALIAYYEKILIQCKALFAILQKQCISKINKKYYSVPLNFYHFHAHCTYSQPMKYEWLKQYNMDGYTWMHQTITYCYVCTQMITRWRTLRLMPWQVPIHDSCFSNAFNNVGQGQVRTKGKQCAVTSSSVTEMWSLV